MLNILLNFSGQLRRFYVAKQSLGSREKRAFCGGLLVNVASERQSNYLNVDIAVTFTPIKAQQRKDDTIGDWEKAVARCESWPSRAFRQVASVW